MLKPQKSEDEQFLFGFNPNANFVSKEAAIDYLAALLVEIYLDQIEIEFRKQESNKT